MFGFDLLHAIYRRLFAHMRSQPRSLQLFNSVYAAKHNKHEWSNETYTYAYTQHKHEIKNLLHES